MNYLVLIENKQEELPSLVNESNLNQESIKDGMTVKGCNSCIQAIEQCVKKSHPSLRPNAGVAFFVELNDQERLVVVQEIKKTYSRIINVDEVVKAIRTALLEDHGLQIYGVVLLKTGSLPKKLDRKIDYHACQNAFLDDSWDAIHTWTLNPQQDLQQLQADVNALLEHVQMYIEQSQFKVS
ncbi:hypothetical protein [Halotia branconii]|uniref:AMP-binding enzyme C-terminal domain-containing protein n=1 Tax=Halotia branconii CENA392 TaxID=1539056 RepID=A0AAJ6NQ82_9CYAN|nr:hypothetical protein [Halotia branconii]WGV24577.1 hypothetical protein QI031_22815 [Halotia branconii CENA392]